jgi:hypothetical protein
MTLQSIPFVVAAVAAITGASALVAVNRPVVEAMQIYRPYRPIRLEVE